MSAPRILVAPLHWGLGHAARCIPVIRELKSQGAEVVIGVYDESLDLLREEFPTEDIFEFPGFRVKYSSSSGFVWAIFRQSNSFRKSISTENELLKKIVAEKNIHGIISDNRYGVHHASIPSVIITHQLNPVVPGVWSVFGKFIRRQLWKHIRCFDACWVPDSAGKKNLSGKLSHEIETDFPFRFIGALSRFQDAEKVSSTENSILILLSGPEPQRSVFEKIIVGQISGVKRNFILVRGTKRGSDLESLPENLRVLNLVNSKELENLFHEASLVISRSGYSTMMDLIALKKNALLVPTPGQTEQEYLAKKFSEEKIFFSQAQNEFNLNAGIESANSFSQNFAAARQDGDALKNVLSEFLKKVKG